MCNIDVVCDLLTSLFVEDTTIYSDTQLSTVSGWDSLSVLRAFTLLEKTFGLRLNIKEFIKSTTPNDIALLIKQQKEICNV